MYQPSFTLSFFLDKIKQEKVRNCCSSIMDCPRGFEAHIGWSSRCKNCFKTKDEHLAAILTQTRRSSVDKYGSAESMSHIPLSRRCVMVKIPLLVSKQNDSYGAFIYGRRTPLWQENGFAIFLKNHCRLFTWKCETKIKTSLNCRGTKMLLFICIILRSLGLR